MTLNDPVEFDGGVSRPCTLSLRKCFLCGGTGDRRNSPTIEIIMVAPS